MGKTVIAFTGPMASGKGTACRFFIEHHGAAMFRFSTMLRDVLDRLYQEHSRDNMQTLSTLLRQQFGQDVMARVIAQDVEGSSAHLIVIDGARRPEDVQFLKKITGFKLVALEATPETRFQRMRARSENPDDAQKTWETFLQQDKAEAEAAIPELMKMADYSVDNSGDTAALYEQLEKIYAQLK